MNAKIASHENAGVSTPQCWCCGAIEDDAQLVRLGNHPEVALCIRCAHAVSKWAWEIEDRAKTGPLSMVRGQLRALRREVIRRGWHKSSLVGGPIRWIGKRLP